MLSGPVGHLSAACTEGRLSGASLEPCEGLNWLALSTLYVKCVYSENREAISSSSTAEACQCQYMYVLHPDAACQMCIYPWSPQCLAHPLYYAVSLQCRSAIESSHCACLTLLTIFSYSSCACDTCNSALYLVGPFRCSRKGAESWSRLHFACDVVIIPPLCVRRSVAVALTYA